MYVCEGTGMNVAVTNAKRPLPVVFSHIYIYTYIYT